MIDLWRYAREDRGRMVRLLALMLTMLVCIGAIVAEAVILS